MNRTADLAQRAHSGRGRMWAHAAVAALTLAYAATFITLNCLKLRNAEWSTIDVANNVHWFDLLLSPWWRSMTLERFSYFMTGVVIQPISLAVALLYKLTGTPFLLPILQSGAIAAGIPLLYLLALKRLNAAWPAFVVAAAYALNPYVNTETMFGFRWDALALPLLILTPLAHELDRRRLFWLALLLGNACKVNVIVINAIYCMLALRNGGASYLRRAFWVCLVWLVAVISGGVLIRALLPNLIFQQTPPGLLTRNLLAPLADDPGLLGPILGEFFHNGAWRWIAQYLLPLLLLPLAAPLYLAPVVLEAGYALVYSLGLRQMPGLWQINRLVLDQGYLFIYPAAFLVCWLHIAAIRGLERISGRIGRRRAAALAGLWLVAAVLMHYAWTPSAFGPVPLTRQFNLKFYRTSEHQRLALQAFQKLPAGQLALLSSVFCERPDGNPQRDYLSDWEPALYHEFSVVLIDLYSFEFGIRRERMLDKLLFMLLSHPGLGVSYFEDGIVEMRMGAPTERNAEVARFISDNLPLLLNNLPNPYTDGGDIEIDPDGLPRFYSPTQLTPEDRKRLGL